MDDNELKNYCKNMILYSQVVNFSLSVCLGMWLYLIHVKLGQAITGGGLILLYAVGQIFTARFKTMLEILEEFEKEGL